MRRTRSLWLLVAVGSLTSIGLQASIEPMVPVEMSPQHPEISRGVTELIEQWHYSQLPLDNSMSSAILDRYLDSLDGNRVYFLASDVAEFGNYRYVLDESAREGDLAPAFNIFNRFRMRVTQRVTYALSLLESETAPDFTVDENYRWDRTELGWPTTEDEMREIWRLRVKNDALTLIMADETWPEATETLRERYERMHNNIADLDGGDAFDTFMNAVAHTMDPHSTYLSPQDAEEYRIDMSASYEGIGARLQEQDDLVEVVEVIPGGPADLDGQLHELDRITGVAEGDEEFTDVVGWRLEDVVQRIRGPQGSLIRLRVLPAGAEPGSPQQVITLTREKVKLEEQVAKSDRLEVTLDDGTVYRIGVITVPRFYQDFAARTSGEADYTSTSRDVTRLIAELEAEGIDGIVMDLRQNGGGHLSEATELSGLFIDRGPVVQVRDTDGDLEIHPDPSPAAVYDGPLAVLVDRYSASASEIFAAAIQDYQRGVIIGQQTFGKGTVQNLFPLDRIIRGSSSGNGQLTLTIGKYYRVTGDSTQNRGVIPDIELPSGIPAEAVGENTRETALPWDRIEPVEYRPRPPLDAAIGVLNERQRLRATSDPNFNYLEKDFSARVSSWNEHTVSLNIEMRRAEQDAEEQAQLERENERRVALGLVPVASLDELTELEDTASAAEILLEQAALAVAEIAAGQPTRAASAVSDANLDGGV
ncbi:MAG TPA: carboxy terminal-processing peptidase [Gammaproteobacteria bacterium]|nr:carboxy terminal-processing peptidase [Gammaproteobacteria bacterium]